MRRQTRGHSPQAMMERYYLGTRVWLNGAMGIIVRCDYAFKQVCVEWTGRRGPAWLSVAEVKYLREALTRAKRAQLAGRSK